MRTRLVARTGSVDYRLDYRKGNEGKMYLYKVTLRSSEKWVCGNKTYTLYVVQKNKEDAISYVNQYKKDKYEISNVCLLGEELGTRMFAKMEKRNENNRN
jgi:hypothetical protein